ncbi:MAG: glycosyltransferase family 39 protein [Gemmatimonadetes bacterium]|nr:glycosyltransferase family 39 protein [Gemmatimonadota bacterium]
MRKARGLAREARPRRGRSGPSGGEEPERRPSRWAALRLPPRTGRYFAVGAALVHLVLALLTYNPSPHMGGDNAGYITLGYSILHRGEYRDLWDPAEPPHTKYPPVYPVILAIAMALGAKTWHAFKLVSVLFTSLGALLAYLWAAERRGRGFGLALALLIAGSNSLLWASHWILSEAPFVAFTLCGLWAFERAERQGLAPRWVVLGTFATLLAYFTRSAGLPLVIAMLAWLTVRRRWRSLAATALAFAVPAALWWWWGRQGAGSDYVSEFWMRDPYRPELGRVDALGLLERFTRNMWLYVSEFVPSGLMGHKGMAIASGGVLLTLLAVWGWARRMRRGPGIPEFLLPLYLGLIFLWPTVWSGDRFALPILPLVVLYAGEAVVGAAKRFGRWPTIGAGALAFLVVAVPAGFALPEEVRTSQACLERVRREGPFACYGDRAREFAAAAVWSGAHLPPDAVVFSRKERIFYVLSRLHSRAYPLTDEPEAFYRAAGEVGVRYVLIDYLDRLGGLYLIPVVHKAPQGFCFIRGFGAEDGQTLLFGLVADQARPPAAVESGKGYFTLDMTPCPSQMLRQPPQEPSSSTSSLIPLLAPAEP